MMLSLFLEAQYGGIAFLGQELSNGAGYVDVLLNFLGVDRVVEIKMVGAKYGYQTALDGAAQLSQYLENYQHPEGYLVIFDGRTTDAGKRFPEEISVPNGTIKVIVVRAYFEAPQREEVN